jgi:uncharacterized protein (TIGR03437 family)
MSRTTLCCTLLSFGLGVSAFAQSFSGFTTGNIVVSRSVYAGSAATLAAGQPLPPVCPSTASCGTAPATASGAYITATSTNNVFNNNIVDGSFGVTSPIFLDQLTPTGTLVSTLPIPTSLVTTSFSSKSEVALNLSTDGTAITFMGYVTPPNTVDVSNANTPLAYDPTNPAGGTFYRAVVQVGANGAIMVTPSNSYSGNNGRAAILANGTYYMVGNANNGGGTPANIIATAGTQMALPGQSFATPPVEIGVLSISQVINPATGLPYPPDKAGKDNNFRGLTIFNNTMYTTKGSGSNGFNTVYRVGDSGSLPTIANAASAAITILPGFPNTLAKASGAMYPFGLFFANATTLYVADEGDGTAANAATSTTSGLQKWILKNGVWTLAYTLQTGLNLGQQYFVANYPATLNPATDGLRNITGQVNANGTVTIWGVTSTVSTNGDQGADPNQLVSVTDVLANTDPTIGAKETFTILRTANAGEVLRGITLAPAAGSSPAANVPLILNAVNPSAVAISPGSIATASGQNLAAASGNSVTITDASGIVTTAQILSSTSNQVTFLVPSTVAIGTAQVTVSNGTTTQTSNNVDIATVSPAIFTANGSGLARANLIQGSASGAQTVLPVYTTNSDGAFIPSPVPVGSGVTSSYLVMLGTGFANAGTALTSATINGVAATVTYAGPSGSPGIDQLNILIPAKLSGAGYVNVQVTTEGVPANPVQITLK